MTAPGSHPGQLIQEDTLDYVSYPKSVSLARRRTARLVAEWGYPRLAGDAALLLSEIATSAILNGCLEGRLLRVQLTLTDTVLRIAVCDPEGERTPRPHVPRDDDQFQRGLLIVQAFATRWGAEDRGTGKAVWFELGL